MSRAEFYKISADWWLNHNIKRKGHSAFPASFVTVSDGTVSKRQTSAGTRYRIDVSSNNINENIVFKAENAKQET